MRKAIIIAFLAFLLVMPLALATKDVVIITSDSICQGETDCSCLTGNEKKYCDRFEDDMGYNILRVVHEDYVVDGTTPWTEPAGDSDLIVTGDVSLDILDGGDRNNFCNNIYSFINDNRKVVFTNLNTLNTTDWRGCAFGSPFNMVEHPYDNSNCSATAGDMFFKINDGFITEIMGERESLFTVSNIVNIHGDPDQEEIGWWIGAECTPEGGLSAGYSTISTHYEGAFWGLIETSKYKDLTWNLFDRTVWDILDDNTWTIDITLIPSSPTLHKDMIVVANITERNHPLENSNYLVNYSMLYFYNKGDLDYVLPGIWENETFADPGGTFEERSSKIKVQGYSGGGSVLRGDETKDIFIGNVSVNILSSYYIPNSDFTIDAEITKDEEPIDVDADYNIRDSTDYSVFESGSLICEEGECTAAIESMPDYGDDFILDINVTSTTNKHGGSYKIISKSTDIPFTLTTDKNSYEPNEKVVIIVETETEPQDVKVTIYRPDGSLETPTPLGLEQIRPTYWNKNYTFSATSKNGTYKLQADVTAYGGIHNQKNKTIDVIPWRFLRSVDSASYVPGEDVTLLMSTDDSYDNGLVFDIDVDLILPNNTVLGVSNFNLTGDSSKNVTYTLPDSASGGTYKFNIYLNDSDGRVFEVNESFTVTIGSASITVTPLEWNLLNPSLGDHTEEFTVENVGNLSITGLEIIVGGNLSITTSRSAITSLTPNGTTTFDATIDIADEEDGTGTITVGNDDVEFIVDIIITFDEGATEQYLSVTPSFITIVTIPGEIIDRTFEIKNDADTTAMGIDVDIPSDLDDIISVKSKPSTIGSDDTADLKLRIDTDSLDEDTYDGVVTVTSSVGDADIDVTINVIGDIIEMSDVGLALLEDLKQNITALKNAGKEVSELETLYDEAKKFLEDAKDAYDSENYAEAVTWFNQGRGKITGLVTAIDDLMDQPGEDWGWMIWMVAGIIIVAILAVLLLKYREEVEETIEEIIRKIKKEPPQEEEGGYYPEDTGYREEYY